MDPDTVALAAAETSSDPVESLYSDLSRLVASLALTGEPSLAVSVSVTASKALLMAAASSFEAALSELLGEVASAMGAPYLANFAVNQGIARKYHTMFQWESSNANKFFMLFGVEFKARALTLAVDDPAFGESIVNFMSIGRRRNELVHSNFAAFPLSNTLEELIEQYRSARVFLDGVRALLLDFSGTNATLEASGDDPEAGETPEH